MSGRIMVVDDIATNRMVLRAKLSAAYFDVIQAESGQEAILRAAEQQPDLILLDIMMPGMDGFETCRRLKAAKETAHIPVIILTSLNEPDDRVRGLECGAEDFLSRPIADLALFSRVRNLLRSKFMLDELRLRDRTTHELGLAEIVEGASDIPAVPGRVVMVPRDTAMARDWMHALDGVPELELRTCFDEEEARALEGDDLPDVFLIHARLDRSGGDGLRLVSHLRSRPHSRNAAVILVVPDQDQVKAAKGLDLGASDYLFDGFDPLELAVRLKNQIRNKQISDRLRDNVTDTMRLAVLDPLTGLYNRRYARQHLAKITERASETNKGFTLMLLDIDEFKRVNDTYGHSSGDCVLKEFSHRIRENLRGVDLVSRLGGEEFLVAMPDTTEEQARAASERLRQAIEETTFASQSGKSRFHVTVSIGVTLGDPKAADVEQLIQEADRALYASKSDGRNMVTLFNSAA